MTRVSIRIALAAAGVFGLLSPAAAQGPIGTVTRGSYVCELPGDASGRAGHPQADAGFVIRSSSRYSAKGGVGTYLRRGDTVIMTSGPHKGESYKVVSTKLLRRIEKGAPTRL